MLEIIKAWIARILLEYRNHKKNFHREKYQVDLAFFFDLDNSKRIKIF